MYSAELLKHFENPQHAGDLADATARVRTDNPVCGDILELSARIENDIVQEIRFRAKGCVPSMACASAICELAQGMSCPEAKRITPEELITRVGGVPQASMHAVQLSLAALRKLLEAADLSSKHLS